MSQERDLKTPALPDTVDADSIEIGVELDLGSYTVNQAEIVEFARQWDPLAIHIDPQSAKTGYFGEIIASGIQTLAIFQRLAVTTYYVHWDVIAGKAFRDLVMASPVRAGDKLTGHMVLRSRTPDTRGRTHLLIGGSLRNQHDRQVMSLVLELIIQARAAPSGLQT